MATPAAIQSDNLPVVALVGRVNVGKSTLFNRLIEEKKAIVSNIPGTTRTSNEGAALWRGKELKIIDTGGLAFTDNVPLEDEIIKQTEIAIKHADIIVMVTDVEYGILPQEKELAKKLKMSGKPIVLVANKVDSQNKEMEIEHSVWSRLNLGHPFLISAANGRNIGDLLDLLFKKCGQIKKRPKQFKEKKEPIIKISIIGKPNVGKSSLFNKLIGEEKAIVNALPHTTRESHNTLVKYENQLIDFIDTAGIRRKTKVEGGLEWEGIGKSLNSIEESDLALFVIDGNETISSQDMQLGGLLEKKSKSVIILVNKWDLSDDNSEKNQKEVKKKALVYFPHLKFSPIMLVSGKTGLNTHKIFPLIMTVWQARQTTITDRDLETFLKNCVRNKQPSRGKGTRHPELMGLRQINTAPPIFELFIKPKTSVHSSYVSYLENKLRERFDFLGTPIVIKLTKMKK
ncbi:MAG: ribosome biogenesis GTPase Der [Patescibacteria group bacterium]